MDCLHASTATLNSPHGECLLLTLSVDARPYTVDPRLAPWSRAVLVRPLAPLSPCNPNWQMQQPEVFD